MRVDIGEREVAEVRCPNPRYTHGLFGDNQDHPNLQTGIRT